jgi:oligopeptide/dipeptide ABC transporter ATP-binding protein
MSADGPLLAIEDLSLGFRTFDGLYQALHHVGLTVASGETVGVVGETGCGKSVLAKSVLRLLPAPPAVYSSGAIRWQGEDVLRAPARRLRTLRGLEIGMIFQDPMTFLDPLYTVGDQLTEVMRGHARVRGDRRSAAATRQEAIAMLRRLDLPAPDRTFDSYPHQLSGGMRQRVLIAMALSGRPRLLIADEPTTALDVTVQAQILRLLSELVSEFGVAVILISHDLGVVAALCERIVVMYAGTIVEDAPAAELLRGPLHPYTRGLLEAVPRLRGGQVGLRGIPGQIPNLLAPPPGCRFAPRCVHAGGICNAEAPKLRRLGSGRAVACHYAEALA